MIGMLRHDRGAGGMLVLLVLCAAALLGPAQGRPSSRGLAQATAGNDSSSSSSSSGSCPIDPVTTDLDFKPVASACGMDSPDYCSQCVCALITAYLPAFSAAGINSTSPDAFPIQKAASVIGACTQDFFVTMLIADVNITALEALDKCNFTSKAPSCLGPAIAKLNSPEVAAASRGGDKPTYFDDVPGGTLPATATGTDLRVASVAADGPTGPTMTLAGQLDGIKDLTDAMLAAPALAAVLSADDKALLQALGSSADAVDASDAAAKVLRGLNNPVDVRKLMADLKALQMAAGGGGGDAAAAGGPPGRPGAAGAAPAPSPRSGAAAAAGRALGVLAAAALLLCML